jgi:hypothetical protein
LSEWLTNYHNAFVPGGWDEASIRLPSLLACNCEDGDLHVEQDSVLKPNWWAAWGMAYGMSDFPWRTDNYAVHIWKEDTRGRHPYENISQVSEYLTLNNSLVGQIANHIWYQQLPHHKHHSASQLRGKGVARKTKHAIWCESSLSKYLDLRQETQT